MEFFRILWNYVEIHGIRWSSMEFQSIPLDSLEFHGSSSSYLAVWASYNIDIAGYLAIRTGYNLDMDYNIDIASYLAIRAGYIWLSRPIRIMNYRVIQLKLIGRARRSKTAQSRYVQALKIRSLSTTADLFSVTAAWVHLFTSKIQIKHNKDIRRKYTESVSAQCYSPTATPTFKNMLAIGCLKLMMWVPRRKPLALDWDSI